MRMQQQDTRTRPVFEAARGAASLAAAAAATTAASLLLMAATGRPAQAQAFIFSTGTPDGQMATASRPGGGSTLEIESADDFLLTNNTRLTSATFTGLLPLNFTASQINDVTVEIYRVFPNDSTNPPDGHVPTRVNSPSDVELTGRDSVAGTLSFTTTVLNSRFTAANSVLNGINAAPNQTTGGEGQVVGQEVQFQVTFSTPFDLLADHYFFVPQVGLTTGNFYWLSAPRPIGGGGTPFTPDLQTWIRNSSLAPDWLRVGTDIVGGTPPPTYNAAFSLAGTINAPEPGSLPLVASVLPLAAGILLRRRRPGRGAV